MKIAAKILVAVLVASLIACSRPTKFRIHGEIADQSATNIYVRYFGNDGVQRGVAPTRDGKFDAEFSSADLALIHLLDNNSNLLGILCLKNGDDVDITIDRANPYNIKIKGNELNEQLSAALNANATALASGDSQLINQAIEEYITANPESVVSTILFAAFYDATDAVRADSVLSLISPNAQVKSLLDAYVMQITPFANPESYTTVIPIKYRTRDRDSIVTFSTADRPISLIVLSNEHSWRSDSVVPQLKNIYKAFPESKLQIIDFTLSSDTNTWRGMTSRDSAKWIQAWTPGGLFADGIDHLAVPTLPYYIVADSAGTQLYRGTSPAEAQDAINLRLKSE